VRRPRLPLLLALCGGLGHAAATAEFSTRPPPPPLPLPPGAAAPAPAPAAPPRAPAAGPWPEQVARPLFAATRRPPEASRPPPAAAAAPEPPPPEAAIGVVLRPGEAAATAAAAALLRLADGRTARVAVGDSVEGGWRVTRIFAEGVELARGGRVVTLAARVPAAEGLARAE
jgi:hypothetical protein